MSTPVEIIPYKCYNTFENPLQKRNGSEERLVDSPDQIPVAMKLQNGFCVLHILFPQTCYYIPHAPFQQKRPRILAAVSSRFYYSRTSTLEWLLNTPNSILVEIVTGIGYNIFLIQLHKKIVYKNGYYLEFEVTKQNPMRSRDLKPKKTVKNF